jgi:hypothetical protein
MFEDYMGDKPAFDEPLEFVNANNAPFQSYFSKIEPLYEQ